MEMFLLETRSSDVLVFLKETLTYSKLATSAAQESCSVGRAGARPLLTESSQGMAYHACYTILVGELLLHPRGQVSS